MTKLNKSIKEQNSDKLREIKEKEKAEKRTKTKEVFENAFKKVASVIVGRARVEYNSFLKLHDETKIGTIEKGTTKKGANVSVVYTQQGPIIQSTDTNIYANRSSNLKTAEVNNTEKGCNKNATYEGFVQNYEGIWIYAKVSKAELWKEDWKGIHTDECIYNIILRDENGKFVTIKNVPSEDHIMIKGKKYPCAQKIYFDLLKRYESELEKIK